MLSRAARRAAASVATAAPATARTVHVARPGWETCNGGGRPTESRPAAGTGDFQDLPLWRKLTAEFAVGLHREYKQPVITPMTLINPEYRDEIFIAIRAAGIAVLHVFLAVEAAQLRRRITAQVLDPANPQADADARAFRLHHVDRGVAAQVHLSADTLILPADQHSPTRLADQVFAALKN